MGKKNILQVNVSANDHTLEEIFIHKLIIAGTDFS